MFPVVLNKKCIILFFLEKLRYFFAMLEFWADKHFKPICYTSLVRETNGKEESQLTVLQVCTKIVCNISSVLCRRKCRMIHTSS